MSQTNWKDWFSFAKRERNGIVVLLILILALLIIQFFLPMMNQGEKKTIVNYNQEIQQWMDSHQPDSADTYKKSSFTQEKRPASLFPFNPNSIDEYGWQKLGMSKGQIKTINNYLNKGGTFKYKEDLAKMYCISSEQYETLKDFILLPDKTEGRASSYDSAKYQKDYSDKSYSTTYPTSFPEKRKLNIEINSADSATLVQLKGIGPYLAGKIVQYRSRLGGFQYREQLLEVYRMDSIKLSDIEPEIHLDANNIHKLNLNKVEYPELAKHPYLSKNQVKALLAYREQHGAFQKIEDIKKSVLIDENTFQKIKGYLLIE
jgi:competence protein ComEA